MIVHVARDASGLVMQATLDEDDTPDARPGRMAGTETRVSLDPDVAPHPDLVALAAILAYSPWAGSFTFDFGVSPALAEAARENLRLPVGPVDPEIAPRAVPTDGSPGLCYSGGADCTAALTVMPPTTKSYFLDRVPRPDEKWRGMYRKEAALHACDRLAASGRDIRVVQTDLEFLRDPVGFPHDFSNALPAVLHADHDSLDSIAWGAILESTYRVGALRFRDYGASPWFVGLGPLFAAVGLPVFNPVAGVSEVGTALVTQASPYGAFSQSCMRGFVDRPCLACWKCARKSLLEASLTGRWPEPAEIEHMVTSSDTPKLFTKEPLKHEVVVAFFTSRYPQDGPSTFMHLLRDRVDRYPSDHLQRHYAPALLLSPEQYRAPTSTALERHLAPMTSDDEDLLRSWDIRTLLEDEDRQEATRAFQVHLQDLIAQR